jgi:methylated-DNA-[protein]-cysteine S-methyltransferase
MEILSRGYLDTPIGLIEAAACARGVVSVGFVRKRKASSGPKGEGAAHVALCLTELDRYFRGQGRGFSVPLDLRGTPFQKKVWARLRKIRYGATAGYGEIAAVIGKPGAARAVGGSNHRNPVGIIVPCHRVIGAAGDLTGYGAGLWRKKWLLEHEKAHVGRP